MITFIIGGARSGKSSFALSKAAPHPGCKVYIATAEALDPEMQDRIEQHKRQRAEDWETREEPLQIAQALRETSGRSCVVLIDCLTLWVSNLLHKKADVREEVESLADALRTHDLRSDIYIVSNEVGMGIVPDNELSRHFRDLAGETNQKVAELADEVYLVVAGIPLKIK